MIETIIIVLGMILMVIFTLLFIIVAIKEPSGKNIFGAIILITVTGFIAFGLIASNNTTAEDVNKSASMSSIPKESNEPVDTTISFSDIYTAFKQNELVAKETYNGNRYRISGKINGIETGGLLNFTGGATLTMEKKVNNTVVFFLAEFEKEQEEALKQIVVGDTITFEGKCWGGNFSNCEIIEN